MTRKAIALCDLLAAEAGIPAEELTASGPDNWQDWKCTVAGGPIRGQWRTMRCVAAAAALGDVQCLVRLRYLFGLPILS